MAKQTKKDLELIEKYQLTVEDLEIIQKVRIGHAAFLKAMKQAAEKAFEIGSLLFTLREKDPAMSWKNIIADMFPFSVGTANKYLKVYIHFKDKPSLLENLSMTEAYGQSGLKCLTEPETKPVQGRLEAETAQQELEFDIEEIFKMPCVSKAKLQNYRIEAVGKSGRLWMIDRSGTSMPVAQLYATPPQGFPETEQKELLRNVQIALELYFEKIEKYEKAGISQKIYEPNGLGNGFYPPSRMQGDVANSEITKAVRKAAKK